MNHRFNYKALGFRDKPWDYRRQFSNAQVQRELGPQFSRNATIIIPGGPGWDNAIKRFNNESRPTIKLVVIPAVESDITTIIKLANRFGVPFLD